MYSTLTVSFDGLRQSSLVLLIDDLLFDDSIMNKFKSNSISNSTYERLSNEVGILIYYEALTS